MSLAALVLGALLGLAGPLITVGVLLGLAAGLLALRYLEVGLWGAIGIATLLPFAALPFKVVFTPTFLDLALFAVVVVYAVQWMTGRRYRLALTPAHGLLALFMAMAVFSFVAGMNNGPLTSNLLRQFGELLLNIALVFVVVDHIDSEAALVRLVRVVLLGATAAAALGIALYVIPDELANRLLSTLGVFGYPAGDVLRYVEDNPENAQRAIATSVDPNVLGGMLAMVGGLLAPQVVGAGRPVLGSRWISLGALALVGACLVLTFSRGAMAALALALLVIAALRYRQLFWLVGAAALLIVMLPATREYVTRFVEGVRGEDLATQMRFGEYKDALILISRYPWLGVGFAGAPEIDIYLGVSSAYLLIAEQMGLLGLGLFLACMAVVLGWALARRRCFLHEQAGPDGSRLPALWLGAHAGLLAALAVGVVDHYFFKLNFQAASTLFWLFVGLCLAATRLGCEKAQNGS